MKERELRVFVLFLMGLLISPAVAADGYPARPVQIVVPYAPGGTGDVIARQLAKKLEEENRFSLLYKFSWPLPHATTTSR